MKKAIPALMAAATLICNPSAVQPAKAWPVFTTTTKPASIKPTGVNENPNPGFWRGMDDLLTVLALANPARSKTPRPAPHHPAP